MPLFSKMMFRAVQWAARKGLRGDMAVNEAEAKHRARRTGVRGETYAYWLLRSRGYIFIARNYTVPGMKGEIDLVGYDGPALAFVEVKTRTADDRQMGLPEDSVNSEKTRKSGAAWCGWRVSFWRSGESQRRRAGLTCWQSKAAREAL